MSARRRWFARWFALSAGDDRTKSAEPLDLSTLHASGVRRGARSYRPEQVLQPVRPFFVWLTLLIAFALNMLPWGRDAWMPDFFAVVLVFWNIHQPRRVGMAAAFIFGLLTDVHSGALFGQHALAYTLLSYGAITLHRRIQWFPVISQILYVGPLLLGAQLITLIVRMWVGGGFPGIGYFGESIVGALFWPIVTWTLLAPQRRSRERDETRPL